MEDQVLRCNNQSGGKGFCRKELRGEAIVTTCSHVLCRECASATGLLNTPLGHRQCPTCKNPLPNQDDAAVTSLNPSEEYKTSVLSGLDPNTIMDCATRALAFWNYQVVQETAYQKHLLKALSGKYGNLSTAMDRVIHEANAEVEGLQGKLSALTNDFSELQQRNVDMVAKDREKVKKYNALRQMYETLKKRYQMLQQDTKNFDSAQRAVTTFTSNIKNDLHHDNSSTITPYRGVHHVSTACTSWKPRGTDGVQADQSLHYRPTQGADVNRPNRMPPPRRPIERDEMNISPFHRAPLPGAIRQPTRGMQHLIDPLRFSPRAVTSTMSYQQVSAAQDGSNHKQTHGSAYGLSAGMKVGSAHNVTEPRFRRHRESF